MPVRVETLESLGVKAGFEVRLVEKPRRHYEVVSPRGSVSNLPGVTSILSMIGGDKTQALIGWAKKEALKRVDETLTARLEGTESKKIVLDRSFIDSLIIDAKKRPKEMLEAAGDIGTRAHAAIDAIIHGEQPTVDPDCKSVVDAFISWRDQAGIHIIAGDTKVANTDVGYAGSLDAWGMIGDKHYILDWKTSNALREEYAMQVAAYAEAAYCTFGIVFDGAFVVRFGKDKAEFEAKKVRDLKTSFKCFLAAKTLYDMREIAHFA